MKGNGGNIKMWGCLNRNGLGEYEIIEGNLNGNKYRNILSEKLLLSANKMDIEEDYILLQDNDPKHTCRIVKEFLREKEINAFLDYPPCSPDLNPIENVWHNLKIEVGKRKAKNLEELRNNVKEAWTQMDLTKKIYFCNLVDSMPERLEAVIKAKGFHTNY